MRRFIPLLLLITVLLPFAAQAAEPFIPNPIKCQTIQCLILGIIRVILGVLAVFATAVFIYGGFVLLTSGGNAELVKKGRETIFWATMGIITVLGGWIFIRFIAFSVINVTEG